MPLITGYHCKSISQSFPKSTTFSFVGQSHHLGHIPSLPSNPLSEKSYRSPVALKMKSSVAISSGGGYEIPAFGESVRFNDISGLWRIFPSLRYHNRPSFMPQGSGGFRLNSW